LLTGLLPAPQLGRVSHNRQNIAHIQIDNEIDVVVFLVDLSEVAARLLPLILFTIRQNRCDGWISGTRVFARKLPYQDRNCACLVVRNRCIRDMCLS